MKQLDNTVLESLVRLVEEAGRIAMRSGRTVTIKEDGSDLTPADMRSHAFLTDGLRQLFGPDVKILSEEGMSAPPDIRQGISIIIDPLDGTTNFKNGKRNYSVLLGVMVDGEPVYGIAVAPAYGITACGGTLVKGAELRLHGMGDGAPYRQVRTLKALETDASVTIVPRRFLETKDPDERQIIQRAMTAFQERAGQTSFIGCGQILGSMMPIFKKHIRCRIYEAVRPNQKPGDWDLVAWDAILRGAGGIMTTMDGKTLTYGNAETAFKHQNFISWRRQSEAAAYATKNMPKLVQHDYSALAMPPAMG